MSYTGTYMKQEIWTSFGYKTGREEDRSSPILGGANAIAEASVWFTERI